MRAPDGARYEARVGGEILIRPDIDEMRAFGQADETGKLVDSYGVGRWHGRPPDWFRDAMLRHVALWGDRFAPCAD